MIIRKALSKWNPILDALHIDDKDLRLFTAVYAEYYQLGLNEASNGIFGVIEQNLLPLNLKIISKLNLSGKTYEFKDDVEEVRMSVNLTRAEVDDIKSATGMDIVQKLEKSIIDTFVTYINKKLERDHVLYVKAIVGSMSLISEKYHTPTMLLSGRFSTQFTNNPFLLDYK